MIASYDNTPQRKKTHPGSSNKLKGGSLFCPLSPFTGLDQSEYTTGTIHNKRSPTLMLNFPSGTIVFILCDPRQSTAMFIPILEPAVNYKGDKRPYITEWHACLDWLAGSPLRSNTRCGTNNYTDSDARPSHGVHLSCK